MTIKQVLLKFKEYRASESTKLIEKAYEFASKAHQGQKRLDGEDRLEHLLQTAYTLALLKLDSTTIAGGLLHDLLDYTQVSVKEIEQAFGPEMTFLIEGVTKTDKIQYKSIHQLEREKERQIQNLRNIFLAMAKDIRVILIKLADLLHNMRTLYPLPKEKKETLALEALEIYAPIAYRLGMGEIKGLIEDAAFPYAYPNEYRSFISELPEKYQDREKYLDQVKPELIQLLKNEKIKLLEIHSRSKHHYSLFKKLKKHDMDWSKIYDLVALRIVVPDVESCYATLGAIHKKWKPLPGRIKDYIAIPKPNGYQSLHTTVFCLNGKIVEIQIRTPKMHKEAEYGIAAHWYYDEKKGIANQIRRFIPWPKNTQQKPNLEKELTWVKQLQDWQAEHFATPEEFIESLKIDFFKDRIFVFTPKGDVIDLPEGATPLDFAYRIHTDVGYHCAGAKIDGKMVNLGQPLENGQVIEIITQKNQKPSHDWLSLAKTSEAKSKIRSAIKKT